MRTLVIKTGATGDVVRTTVLLRFLQGEIHWITSAYNSVILPELANLRIHQIEDLPADLFDLHFDLVINLEEDPEIARIAQRVSSSVYTGPYLQDGRLVYTDESSGWFDMSLISRFGSKEANRLKLANRRTYQGWICEMLGWSFHGEKYCIRQAAISSPTELKVGIEERVGKRWPNKQWAGFSHLRTRLTKYHYRFEDFDSRTRLLDYMDDINKVSVVVSGDTLAMHLALAYGKPCVGIFTCTSPHEIYDYGLLQKVVSTRLPEFFYTTDMNPTATNAIDVNDVWEPLAKLLR